MLLRKGNYEDKASKDFNISTKHYHNCDIGLTIFGSKFHTSELKLHMEAKLFTHSTTIC